MIGRGLLCGIGAVFLVAADEPPAVPTVLEPYLDEEATFVPGDWGFMRGAFDDASEQEAADYAEYVAWRQNCFEESLAQLRLDLSERGYDNASLQGVSNAPLLCRMASMVPQIPDHSSFTAFEEEVQRVRPIYESYLLAMHNADAANRPRSDEFATLLERRVLGEQVLRNGFSWGQGAMANAPEVTPVGLAILRSALGMEMAWHDDDNTAWLKQMVAEHGWPRLSEVGPEASQNAWLLAQHADADPLFQLDALRMMEPLLADGEVNEQNYAYLYDRVMLKLAGKQRYGTQAHCPAGEFEPQPLEDESMVDHFRTEVGLPPLAEYMAFMLEQFGPCTPPPSLD